MLRTLLTKEIKVFHSPSQVGLAYMVAGILEREKRDIFLIGYFSCREPRSPVISLKTAFSFYTKVFGLDKFAIFDLEYAPNFVSASNNWYSTCSVKHIAILRFLLNADRKK
jgi:hypothetical protein